jgi:hypothetical protein
MVLRLVKAAFGFFFLCLFSGCQLVNDARGLDVKLAYDDLKQSTDNELKVLGDLARRAGYTETSPSARPETGYWYYVTVAGFSYIDEKCDQYLRALYDLDRNRDRFQKALLVLDKTSNAIMGATNTSTRAMQIVAQAFGAGAGLTDAFVDRYEFRNEPAIIFLTVDKMRAQFRSDVARLAPSVVSSGHSIIVLRNYLKICQPNSIEAVVNNYVAVAVAAGNTGAPIEQFLGTVAPQGLGGPRVSQLRSQPPSVPAPVVAATATGTAIVSDATAVRVGLTSPR